MTLYHYTCAHGRKAIGRRGMLRPNAHPVLAGRRLLWLTDQDNPQRDALGLTSHILSCDRLAYRYRVEVTARDVVPWDVWKQSLSHTYISALEAVPGAEPSLWFVSETSLLGELDRHYVCEVVESGR